MRQFHSNRVRAMLLASCFSAMALAAAVPEVEENTAGAAGESGSPADIRVVDSAGQPVAEAVVWFGKDDPRTVAATELAVISQVDKQFVPEITVIRAGARIEFPNKDSVSHHVYSFAQPNAFEFALYKSGERPTFRFEHAGVVALGCNIHDSMLGYIVVVDTPHYAQTNADGYASFASAPVTGEAINVWSPRLDPGKPLVVNYGGDNIVAVAQRLRPESRPAAGSLAWEDY